MSSFANSDLPRDMTRSRFGSVMTAGRSVALAAGLLLAGVTGAMAQDATPAAGAAECVAPATTMDAAAASPAASPTDEAGQGTPANDMIAADAIAALENFTACFNSGEVATALSLMTPNFLATTFGTDDAAMIEGYFAMAPVPQTEILSIGNVLTYEDGRVSVDSEYMTGEHQFTNSRTFMVQAGDSYLVDGEDFLPGMPEGNASIISYTIPDDTASLAFDQTTSAAQTDVIVLYGANNGAAPHTVALIRLPDEAAGTPVAEITPDQMMGGEPIGAIAIEAGAREQLILVDLPVGTYLLLDTAVPGSAQVLDVTEPAAEE